jgi:hypothetical protein
MFLVAGHDPVLIRLSAERDHFTMELEGTEGKDEGRDHNDERKHLQKQKETEFKQFSICLKHPVSLSSCQLPLFQIKGSPKIRTSG